VRYFVEDCWTLFKIVDFIHLDQNRDQCEDLVDTVIESGVPKKVRSCTLWDKTLFASSFVLFSCLAYLSTLSMKASVDFQRTIFTEDREKSKAIPVIGRGGPYVCETSRLPHFLDNWLRDGGEFFSRTRRPSFTPRRIPVRG
jgi:hypothetical protein